MKRNTTHRKNFLFKCKYERFTFIQNLLSETPKFTQIINAFMINLACKVVRAAASQQEGPWFKSRTFRVEFPCSHCARVGSPQSSYQCGCTYLSISRVFSTSCYEPMVRYSSNPVTINRIR
ncbi:hypothetical protein ATANTOWER_006790 [Ataeniobius toweri]|uniref:Uncharacterized protein n=1 Tax=Ataeniobius toweri TaxID=208326 RepID=A0ABU7B7P1_9TELE|nr:hypothetical protein [Ataeniobius toweri]